MKILKAVAKGAMECFVALVVFSLFALAFWLWVDVWQRLYRFIGLWYLLGFVSPFIICLFYSLGKDQ